MDKLSYFVLYYAFQICLISMQSFMAVIFIKRIVKELKSNFFDYLKLLQCIAFLFGMFGDIGVSVFSDLFPNYSVAVSKAYNIYYSGVIGFHMSNQMTWYIVMMHMDKYKQMRESDISYKLIRKSIFRIERGVISIFALFIMSYFSVGCYMLSIQLKYDGEYDQEGEAEKQLRDYEIGELNINIENWLYIINAVILVLLALSEMGLYAKLIRYLKNQLNSIYHQNYTKLRKLMITSIIGIASFIVTFIIPKIFLKHVDVGSYKSIRGGWAIFEIYAYFILIYLSNFPFNFYGWRNIDNVNFKRYLFYVAVGNRIEHHFEKISIFISGKYKEVSFNESEDSEADLLRNTLKSNYSYIGKISDEIDQKYRIGTDETTDLESVSSSR